MIRRAIALAVLGALALVPPSYGGAASKNAFGKQMEKIRAAAVGFDSSKPLTGRRNVRLLAANGASFADASGDNEAGLAPDLTGIGMANDDAGTISVRIDVPNRPGLFSGDFLSLWLDTDQNPATGPTGSEYVVVLDGETGSYALGRWNGGAFDFSAPPSLSASFSYGASITINRADLGGATGFNFWAGASWSEAYEYYDFAPFAGGTWNYQVLVAAAAPSPPPPPPPPPPSPPAVTVTKEPGSSSPPSVAVAGRTDAARATAHGDVLRGGAARDILRGLGGDDTIFGKRGDDVLHGGPGRDYLYGDAGDDLLVGGPGRDALLGGVGDDVVSARDGTPDKIACGPGKDVVTADRVDRVARGCEVVRLP